MNFLAHAYLSGGDPELLTGNMLGDFVKGQRALETFPPRIAAGIRLHRAIDAASDIHPAVMRAKLWFREDYGLYAGPILDTLWDHFVANDPKLFADAPALKAFSTGAYAALEAHSHHFPPAFAGMFPHMQTGDWLYGYRTLQGVQRSLGGLLRRAPRMGDMGRAYRTFIGWYYALNQCYFELMDTLQGLAAERIAALGDAGDGR